MAENCEQEKKIIDAARKLFIEKGFSETSMSDIAVEAGMTRTALHYYFRTKDKMFQAVFGDIMMSVVPAVHGIIASDRPVQERIEKIVDIYTGIFCSNPSLPAFIVREIIRDPALLVATATTTGLAQYGRLIISDLSSEMENGHLKKVPIYVVFNTFYALLLFPFLSSGLSDMVFQDCARASRMNTWKSNIVSQMSHLLVP